MAPHVETVELRTGVALEYVEHGESTGVPVLLLHGLADSWHSYERVLPHLPPSVRAFALTQRGHGDSSRPDASYGTRDFANDVAAFMDALDVESAVVVGHSLGSSIAQRFAIDHPTRTRGLVLAASFLSLGTSDAARQVWDAVSSMRDSVDEEFVREFQESTLASPVPDDFFETIIHESMKVPAEVWKQVVGTTRQEDFAEELYAIEAPTLLVWGDRDEMVPRPDQDAQMDAIAHARLVVYDGAGHAVHWEEPERFASDVASFARAVAD